MSALKFSEERLMKVLVAPVISEKATMVAEKNEQIVFRVLPDATKPEIKELMIKSSPVSVTCMVRTRPKVSGACCTSQSGRCSLRDAIRPNTEPSTRNAAATAVIGPHKAAAARARTSMRGMAAGTLSVALVGGKRVAQTEHARWRFRGPPGMYTRAQAKTPQ